MGYRLSQTHPVYCVHAMVGGYTGFRNIVYQNNMIRDIVKEINYELQKKQIGTPDKSCAFVL